MKLVRTEKIDTNLYELEIRVDGEEYKAGLERSYKKNAPKLNIHGFRKGKAPKAMVLKMVGEEYFYEDAVNLTYSDAYRAALEESGLDPVDQADVELKEVSGEGYTFLAKVTTRPEVTLGDYKGLSAVKPDTAVTDEEVQGELDRMADRNSRLLDVDDRPAAEGDTTEIDFEGFVDGVAFPGGKGEKYTLVLGSGQFIPGFEAQVAGHSVGEEFDVNVKFPDEYHEESLKGKDATFKVKLHSIKKKEVPALDDEFAKDVSEFDTLAELREDLGKKLRERKEEAASQRLENELVEQAAKNAQMVIPQVMIDRKIDEMVQDFSYRLQSQGLELPTYLKYAGMEMDAFRDGFKAGAEEQVRVSLTLDAIAKAEAFEISDEAVEEEYKKMAEAYGIEAEKVKGFVPKADVVSQLRLNKAIDLIRETAVLTDAPAEEKKAEEAPKAEKPKRKAPAKKKAEKAEPAAEEKKAEEAPKAEKPKRKAPAKKKAEKAEPAKETAE